MSGDSESSTNPFAIALTAKATPIEVGAGFCSIGAESISLPLGVDGRGFGWGFESSASAAGAAAHVAAANSDERRNSLRFVFISLSFTHHCSTNPRCGQSTRAKIDIYKHEAFFTEPNRTTWSVFG